MFKNIAANYLGRLYSAASVYLFVPFYIRYLGVDSYGVIAFYAVLLTFASISDVGLSAVMAREAARQSKGQMLFSLLSSIERIVFIGAGVIAIAIFGSAHFIANRWLNLQGNLDPAVVENAIRLMALMIIPQLCLALYTGGLMGLQQQVRANALQTLFVTMRSGFVIPLIYWQPSLEYFFAWQSAVTIAFALAARSMLATSIGGSPLKIAPFNLSTISPHLKFSGGLLVLSVISILSTQLDKLVTSKLFSIEQFGYYVIASTLAQLPLVAIGPLIAAYLPRLTILCEQGRADAASRLYENCCFFVSVLGSVSAVAVMLFAGDLLSIWLAGRTVPADVVLVAQILAAGSMFLSFGTTPYYLGLANGESSVSARVGCVTVGLSIVLLLILAPRFGLIGAAIPWVTLNAGTAIVLSTIMHRRFYIGSAFRWWTNFTILPALFATVPLLAARVIADFGALRPVWACCLAGVFGAAGVLAIMRWRVHEHGSGIHDS